MKAVIMAGGEGSRLRPLTCDRPKPLVPIGNRPVMAYTLDLLAHHGFQEVFVTLGYMPRTISACFGDRYRGMALRYCVEESPLGTGGGVAALRPWLDETFVVMSGDVLTDIDLELLLGCHRHTRALVTMATVAVANPTQYGIVATDHHGRIRRFVEKPVDSEVFSDRVNTGIYVVEPAALDHVPPGLRCDFSRHLFPLLLRLGAPLYATAANGYWCDVGDPDTYLRANLDLLLGKVRHQPAGSRTAPGVWVAGKLPDGVTIDGPAVIAQGCRLAPGTRLEGGVVLGPETVTGAGAVLRRTVTWSGVRVGAEAQVTGAILCDGAALAERAIADAGVIVSPVCVALNGSSAFGCKKSGQYCPDLLRVPYYGTISSSPPSGASAPASLANLSP